MVLRHLLSYRVSFTALFSVFVLLFFHSKHIPWLSIQYTHSHLNHHRPTKLAARKLPELLPHLCPVGLFPHELQQSRSFARHHRHIGSRIPDNGNSLEQHIRDGTFV